MITMHQLWLLMQRVYPDKTPGKDFIIAAPVNPDNPTEQGEDASIAFWAGPEPAPNIRALLGMYGGEIEDIQQRTMGRFTRNRLLGESDALVTDEDTPHQKAVAKYRQALRDVPQQPGFPTDIKWPVKPVLKEE